jgi:hypothetical protein
MGSKIRGSNKHEKFKIIDFEFLHIIAYGQPACAMIENEYGVIPVSCLTYSEKVQYDNQRRLKFVRQSIKDSLQHYDIDGVFWTAI